MSEYMQWTGKKMYASITLPKPQVGLQHPFLNGKNHEKLLCYLQQRLWAGKEFRDKELNRFVRIDKSVAGWMRLDDEDQKRDTEQQRSGNPQAKNMNLPLAFVHLDDMMTYFAQTFAPTRGMFYNTGKADEVGPASQIVTIMNNHAIYAGYYREMLQGIYGCLKYNRGGFKVEWTKDSGPAITNDGDGNAQFTTEIKWQGNRLEAIDIYNFLADPTVHPTKLHSDGEFAATVKMRSHYWLQSLAAQGYYFNCATALDGDNGIAEATYFRNPPDEARMAVAGTSGTDWRSVLSAYSTSSITTGYELTEVYCKLNPTEFGLIQGGKNSERSRFETWRFTILNNKWIIDATYMNNIHGYLPYFMGLLNDDAMGTSQKSVAEILTPLQDFASFLLNTHIKANRKNIWGTTVYDPSIVDFGDIPAGEVSARLAIKPTGYGKDIKNAIWHDSEKLDTTQTMGDLDSLMNIVNQFFPTQSLPSQIANIDRAVDSQVAAVQQGANRRQQKAGRLLDDTIMRNMRAAMYYNLIQYQPDDVDVQDFYTGKPIRVDLTALRATDLPFIIGQGLKALDRQAAAQALQQVIFALIQAPQAAQRVDLLGMIDYWTSMIDIDIDMKSFELAPPPQEGGGVADAGGQAAPGATTDTVVPATNPQKFTGPIYS